MAQKISILIGTTKGAFILEQDGAGDWQPRGPFCSGWGINHVVADQGTGTIYAGGGGDWTGAGVWRSDDQGETWTKSQLTSGTMHDWARDDPDFAKAIGFTDDPLPFGEAFSSVWSLSAAHGKLFAGTKPARLLESSDGGQSWSEVTSLTDHPSAKDWNPGAAGLTLHTIVRDPGDPDKTWIGISAAGVFATEDGGASWERRNRMSNAQACEGHDHPAAPADGETGHCVHNMVRADGPGDLLYQQNHHGVWRSADGGRSWDDITDGLPSTFGFPIAVHPRDASMIWTVPLNGDTQGRFPPDAAAAVWTSKDGGDTWTDCRAGLPQKGCYFTVLRQAMAAVDGDPAHLAFGTNSGSIFLSTDDGQTWEAIANHLPTVLSVEMVARHDG